MCLHRLSCAVPLVVDYLQNRLWVADAAQLADIFTRFTSLMIQCIIWMATLFIINAECSDYSTGILMKNVGKYNADKLTSSNDIGLRL